MNKKKWLRRAQISLEYLLITAFAFAILIPGIYFFYSYTKGGTSDISATQFDRIGEEIMSMALKTASQGKGSWFTLELTVPDSIINMSLNFSEREFTIRYWSNEGETESVFFPGVQLNTTDATPYKFAPHPGKTYFKFTKMNKGIVFMEETIPN